MELQSTKTYGIFKTIKGNRPLNQGHLRRLTAVIVGNNLLKHNPIIVNSQMEVIDGQHRLEVAKNNNLEIFYLVSENSDLREVQMLNANTKPWSMQDYMESYIAQGKKDYQILKDYSRENYISLSNAMMCLTNSLNTNRSAGMIKKFKSGEFEVTDVDYAREMVDKLADLKVFTSNFAWHDRELLFAIAKMEAKGGDWNQLIKKADDSGLRIERSVNVRGYLHQLEEIYNYNQKSNRASFY